MCRNWPGQVQSGILARAAKELEAGIIVFTGFWSFQDLASQDRRLFENFDCCSMSCDLKALRFRHPVQLPVDKDERHVLSVDNVQCA